MRLLHDVEALDGSARVVLVPTMGALHEGHAALIERARALADRMSPKGEVVVSVFVNPAQFDEAHDFEAYPRTLEADADRAARAGADALLAPSVETVYPAALRVETPELPRVADGPGLEDRCRPGHFAGVCKVCKRLFEMTGCAAACFGEKDWQQLQVVGAMVTMLGMPVRIEPVATVRERDGLALSSRNVHLGAPARAQASAVPAALVRASGCADPADAEAAGAGVLDDAGIGWEYFAIRDAQTLERATPGRPARALVAARIGGTRLIDNAPWPGFELPAG